MPDSKEKNANKKSIKDDKPQSKKKHKLYYAVFTIIAAVVVFCTVYSLILPAITLTTQPNGAQTNSALSYTMYSNTKSYRAYLEYSLPISEKSETFGVLRQSVIYVYAYAGETICLGSDIVHSRIDENDNSKNAETGVDILVIGPDGTKYTFDNDDESGLGYIGTAEQEKNGANYTGSGNTKGYTPHELLVRNTGVYEIRFHSFDARNASTKTTKNTDEPHLRPRTNYNLANTATLGGNADPAPVLLTSNDWANTGATVGAFDATVIRDGEVKTGRAYADYLALNMGKNNTSPAFYADFYMVTSDGYIYRSKYNLDPFGFIFFANSRGVVDTSTGYSAYHSIRANGQKSGTAEMDITNMHYTVFTPQNESTIFDKTYRIFFEEPDIALQGTLYQRAFAPEKVKNIEFIGSKEGNITYVGNGGYFKFDTQNATSVTITINFDEYNETHDTNYQSVVINANVTDGTNYVYWDGNDSAGSVIPVGWYREGKIDISINAHTGEIHFPFLDVENGDGVSFERVNRIYDYVDGVLTDVTEDYEDSRFTIYYNNTTFPDLRNNPKYVEGTAATYIADDNDRSNGVDSQNLQMYWRNTRGDYSILDVWTYAVANQQLQLSTDIIIEDLDDYYTANLTGLVFFDKDESTNYDIVGGDFPLDNVKVSLDYNYCGTRWEHIERDEDGNVTLLMPMAHTSSEEGDNSTEVIDYYYHHYVVMLNEEDGLYHLYNYAPDDRMHEGDVYPSLDKDGNEIIVQIDPVTLHDDEHDEDYESFLVWIPVHRETTTNAIGEYYFPGVLVNENFYDTGDYDDIVITVENPDPELYNVTTHNTITGDFGTTGTEVQHISLSQLYEMIERDKGESDRTNFTYQLADVGYYFETHDPPLILFKRWGTIEDSNDVEQITFKLQGYVEKNNVRTICYERDVTVDYHSWMKELTDLPASFELNGEKLTIQYRVVSETYVKSGADTYIYTYHWDAPQPYGTYEKVLTFDENGDPDEKELLSEDKYPYESYISPIENANTNDYIYVENWSKKTTELSVIKYGADDNISKLSGATFLLQKQNENGNFVNVMTANGVYTVTTDNNGKAVFRGLSAGTYRVVETVAPVHYEKAKDVIFEINEDGTVNNASLYGDYDNGYLVDIYDELSEAPVSKLVKYDQYGNTVSGATFAAYPADDNYNYNANAEPAFTLTTGDDGSATLYTQRADGTVREMYISELKEMLSGAEKFVLVETGVPDGYRSVGEAHMKLVGSGMSSYVICENPYESGVWASPNAIVYATDELQIVNESDYGKISNKSYVDDDGTIHYTQYSQNGQISSNGTLFAVVLKRDGAEASVTDIRDLTGKGWDPVYGDDINGYHTETDFDNTLDAVIDVAHRKYAVEFSPNSDGNQMYAHLENFPGYSTRYYTYYLDNNLQVTPENPQYLVAYYFTTASSAEAATAQNTVQVRSHGFPEHGAAAFDIKWSTVINASDISNNLFVQKRDTEDFLVNNAVFGLYNAVADSQGNGYYIGESTNGDTVYIRLSESGNMSATIYDGYINSSGVLVVDDSQRTGTFSVNDDGCNELMSLSKEEIADKGGYILSDSGKTGVITVEGNNGEKYTIKPAIDALERSCVTFTHDKCARVDEVGTAHFTHLLTGKYLLREICAPPGFKLNYTNTEVVVNDNEVYANAGDKNDGVRVGNGVGYLISTMNVFGSIGDINESLSYIVAALRLNADPNAYDGFTDMSDVQSWEYVSLDPNDTTKYIFTGDEQTGGVRDSTVLYLRYNGDANHQTEESKTLFDYTVSPEAANHIENVIDSLLFWTESGWSDLAIFQHYSYATRAGVENANTAFTDLSIKRDVRGNPIYDEDNQVIENDLSYLFSSSTFVSYEDESEIALKLKKISSTTEEELPGAEFVFYYTENNTNYYYSGETDEYGKPIWTALTGDMQKSDMAITTDELGEIKYDDLRAREYYLEELTAPEGYMPIEEKIIVSMMGGELVAMKENGAPLRTEMPDGTTEDGEFVYTVYVPNNGGLILPETGGSTILYYTFGILLILSAGALMCGYAHWRKFKEGRVAD